MVSGAVYLCAVYFEVSRRGRPPKWCISKEESERWYLPPVIVIEAQERSAHITGPKLLMLIGAHGDTGPIEVLERAQHCHTTPGHRSEVRLRVKGTLGISSEGRQLTSASFFFFFSCSTSAVIASDPSTSPSDPEGQAGYISNTHWLQLKLSNLMIQPLPASLQSELPSRGSPLPLTPIRESPLPQVSSCLQQPFCRFCL